MKILAKEINGNLEVLEIEDPSSLNLRNRLSSCNFYYITDPILKESKDDQHIKNFFNNLHEERRKVFFPSC